MGCKKRGAKVGFFPPDRERRLSVSWGIFILPRLCLFFLAGATLSAQEEVQWYRSNSSGMALEAIPSRLAAQRNEYSLSVEIVFANEIPSQLFTYYDFSYAVELRVLYENGEEIRRQWLFRDSRNTVRLLASGSAGLFGGKSSEEENRSGFIEFRNSEGSIVRELIFAEDLSEWEYRFTYRENTLLRAEALYKESPVQPDPESGAPPETGNTPPVFVPAVTDDYRYTRSGSLRAIDRTLHEGAGDILARLFFPALGTEIFTGGGLIFQTSAYIPEFLQEVHDEGGSVEGTGVNFSFDNRGRVLSEVWKDDEGLVLGELTNTWIGDRLQSVLWKSSDEERLIEYEYDGEGSRVVERNFRDGILERSVVSRDGRDTEEIFMDGRLMLRAIWENGVRISEERFSPSGGRSR